MSDDMNRGFLMFASVMVVLICSVLSVTYGRPPDQEIPLEGDPGGGCTLCAVTICDTITGCDGQQMVCAQNKLACCCSVQGSGAWSCACQTADYCTSPPSGTVCR